jgi:hypothetical protein
MMHHSTDVSSIMHPLLRVTGRDGDVDASVSVLAWYSVDEDRQTRMQTVKLHLTELTKRVTGKSKQNVHSLALSVKLDCAFTDIFFVCLLFLPFFLLSLAHIRSSNTTASED